MSKTAKGRYANLGTVSEGTLKDEELVDAFASELEALYKYTGARIPPHVKEMLSVIPKLDSIDYEDGDASDLVDELSQELEHFAPPFGYFGTLEGDGAHFGFWISEDALREAIHEGELLVQDDSRGGRQDKVPKGYTGLLLHVSDHGNQALHQYTRGKYAYTIW